MYKQNHKMIEVRVRVRFWHFLVAVLCVFISLLFSLAHLNIQKRDC